MSQASTELDRRFALETVAVLRAWDNVDGLFADYVQEAFRDYLAAQSRFVAIDATKVNSVLSSSKIPYGQLIEDPKILLQASRTLKAETLVRTRVYKENSNYRFQVDWLLAPQMEILSSDTFRLEQPAPGKSFGVEELQTRLQQSLDRVIRKIPIQGHVTGRDQDSVTVNLGRSSGIRRGDTLKIGTLEEVKRHPLLKTVVDWRFDPTGEARVESVEDALSFAKILQENDRRPIARYQKIVTIIKAEEDSKVEVLTGEEAKARELRQSPKNGWFDGTLWIGSFKRDYSSSPTSGKSGSGFLIGAKAEGQLWLTREWFTEMTLAGATSGYSQKDTATGVATASSGVSASLVRFKLGGGYTFFSTPDLFGPRGWIKGGFQTTSYRLPLSAAEETSSNSVKGLFLGVGGALPLREPFGLLLNLDFGILTSASDDNPAAASISGASSVNFYIGGYYRLDQRMTLKAGFEILSQGADYASGAGFSQKVITFGPSLVYYF